MMCWLVEEFFSRKSSLRAWTCMESCLSTSDACKQRRLSGGDSEASVDSVQRESVNIFLPFVSQVSLCNFLLCEEHRMRCWLPTPGPCVLQCSNKTNPPTSTADESVLVKTALLVRVNRPRNSKLSNVQYCHDYSAHSRSCASIY